MDLVNLFASMLQVLREEQVCIFFNLIWTVWKARCTALFENKRITVQKILLNSSMYSDAKYLKLIHYEQLSGGNRDTLTYEETCHQNGVLCYVDCSYQCLSSAGIGYLLFAENVLVQNEYQLRMLFSLFHSEAAALHFAVQQERARGIRICMFLTDCEQLVSLMNIKDPPISMEWQAHRDVMAAYQILQEN